MSYVVFMLLRSRVAAPFLAQMESDDERKPTDAFARKRLSLPPSGPAHRLRVPLGACLISFVGTWAARACQ